MSKVETVIRDCLDTINAQQARIEELQADVNFLFSFIDYCSLRPALNAYNVNRPEHWPSASESGASND